MCPMKILTDGANAQADLNLHCMQIFEGTFSDNDSHSVLFYALNYRSRRSENNVIPASSKVFLYELQIKYKI